MDKVWIFNSCNTGCEEGVLRAASVGRDWGFDYGGFISAQSEEGRLCLAKKFNLHPVQVEEDLVVRICADAAEAMILFVDPSSEDKNKTASLAFLHSNDCSLPLSSPDSLSIFPRPLYRKPVLALYGNNEEWVAEWAHMIQEFINLTQATKIYVTGPPAYDMLDLGCKTLLRAMIPARKVRSY